MLPVLLLLATVALPAAPDSPGTAMVLPGREADGRVARVTDRLTTPARARCVATEHTTGILLQHLSQFALVDRAGEASASALADGPGVVAIVAGGPAVAAGVRAGDILLSVNGTAVPPEPGMDLPFDAKRAHARADAVSDLLASATPLALDVRRDGERLSLMLQPRPGCTARVRLARSGQRNAYADGRHVFLTTGLLALLRNDDELAFVIAHELAHNQLGHAAAMRGDGVHPGLGRGRRVVREAERAADAMAGEMMLDAGYDPVLGTQLLPRLGSGMRIALFADHASDRNRIEAMRRLSERRPRP